MDENPLRRRDHRRDPQSARRTPTTAAHHPEFRAQVQAVLPPPRPGHPRLKAHGAAAKTEPAAHQLLAPAHLLQLEVSGVGPVRLPVRAPLAKKLIAVARPAMFGRGEETLTDTGVRDTWELIPDQQFLDAVEGGRNLSCTLHPSGGDITFETFMLDKECYERAAAAAGLSIEWIPLEISQDGIDAFAPGFWQDAIDNPSIDRVPRNSELNAWQVSTTGQTRSHTRHVARLWPMSAQGAAHAMTVERGNSASLIGGVADSRARPASRRKRSSSKRRAFACS